MPGDISRDTFHPRDSYAGVRMQQGRVLLDADWNEQEDISRNQLSTFVADVLGPHCGFGDAFRISPIKHRGAIVDLEISPGHYYVDGILCDNAGTSNDNGTIAPMKFSAQPNFPFYHEGRSFPEDYSLVYLDVWKRDITAIEDPALREPALGGVDTTTRLKFVWQVRTASIAQSFHPAGKIHKVCCEAAEEVIRQFGMLAACGLRVRIRQDERRESTSLPASGSGYLGAENHLYRVQVHTGGTAQPGTSNPATFKWSRDNGSVAASIMRTVVGGDAGGATVEVKLQGAMRSEDFHAGDWVELLDDGHVLLSQTEPLVQVVSTERTGPENLRLQFNTPIPWVANIGKCPVVRRWDHKERPGLNLVGGAIPIEQSHDRACSLWIPLENGIEIQFTGQGAFRSGDYWLIAARTATRDVEWPREADGTPGTKLPDGIVHHYAPLAIVSTTKKNGKRLVRVTDCRVTRLSHAKSVYRR